MAEKVIKLEDAIQSKVRMVIPNDQELDFIDKTGQRIIYDTQLAVKVFKCIQNGLRVLAARKDAHKTEFENVCAKYKRYDFIPFFQLANGYELTPDQLSAIEEIQNIRMAKYMLFYEQNTSQSYEKFAAELDTFKARNKEKVVIPLLDPAEKDLLNLVAKAQNIIKQKYKICGIFSRHYNSAGWNKIMPLLKSAGIFVIVFGVYPRYTFRDKNNEYSLLIPPLLMGANAVSHGLAWSGGKAKIRFLKADWIYHEEKTTAPLPYKLSRADAVINANRFLVENIGGTDMLELAGTIKGVKYFARAMKILDKGGHKSLFDF